jgi:hypothetical protein
LHLEGERAVGERACEVVEALALDGGEQPAFNFALRAFRQRR